jgi:hypothetical protein
MRAAMMYEAGDVRVENRSADRLPATRLGRLRPSPAPATARERGGRRLDEAGASLRSDPAHVAELQA